MKLVLNKILESFGLVLVAGYKKSTKSSFGKTSNCHNFRRACQNWTYPMQFWRRKMRSMKFVVKKTKVSWLGPGCRIQKPAKSGFWQNFKLP